MRNLNLKYYSGGESDGADAEYIYVNYMVDTTIENEYLKSKEYTPKTNTENAMSYRIITNQKIDDFIPDELQKYRSVVFTSPENTLLSFSPPSGISLEEFQGKYPEITDDIYVNQCIEGSMINLFYDSRIGGWEIATKSAIGANYWYYRTQYSKESLPQQRTFRHMFLDAFRANEGDDLNSLAFLEYLPKEYSYSFVLQHPENHIVQKVDVPIVYLVAVYHICDNRAIFIPPIIYEEWDCFINIRGLVEFPPAYDNDSYDDYMTQTESPNFMGYMLTNLVTGEKCHIENPSYSYLRELRSNHPNMQFLFYELRRSGRVNEFLYYFPQYLELFTLFHIEYQTFVTHIHGLYVTNYIKRTGEKCPAKYFPLVYKLHHEVFIPSMAANMKIVMRKPVVDDFLCKLTSGAMLHYLN